jgi:hypothetical protein
MTEHAMPDATPNAADLFAIIRTTRSMRRLKPNRELSPNFGDGLKDQAAAALA